MRHILIPPALSREAVREHAPDARVFALDGATMGTYWQVHAVDAGSGAACAPATLRDAVREELDEVVAQMSTWLPESDLSRFNGAPAGAWQAFPPALFAVFEQALALARNSGGAFDPTVGPVVNLWGFGPTGSGPHGAPAVPTRSDLAATHARVGWQGIELDRARRAARQPGGAYVDLSGIAKGYAVDAVARRLRGMGVPAFLVEVGGELAGHGVKPGPAPWWVDLERPGIPGGTDEEGVRIALHGLAVATSGNHLRCFTEGGRAYGHTIDPRSGWPVAHELFSVTVLHPECMAADALATALLVMGQGQGMDWAAKNGIAAVFLGRDGSAAFTPACKPMLD